jgi:hypothetical protein
MPLDKNCEEAKITFTPHGLSLKIAIGLFTLFPSYIKLILQMLDTDRYKVKM